MTRVCVSCDFWKLLGEDLGLTVGSNGECRAHPPSNGATSEWPFTLDTDWCGEWKETTNKTKEENNEDEHI